LPKYRRPKARSSGHDPEPTTDPSRTFMCPHCMKALEVEASELVEGAVVTDREKLFSNVGPSTVVFSY